MIEDVLSSVSAFLFTYPGRTAEFILIFFAASLAAFEYLVARFFRRNVYEPQDTWVTIQMYAGYILIFTFVIPPFAMALFGWLNSWAPVSIGALWWYFLGNVSWTDWLLVFVAVDFVFYWFHRYSHRFRLFWTSHAGHHTSEQFNLSVGFRQAWTPFFWLLFVWPLALFGVDAKMIAMITGINLAYQTLIHTQLIRTFGVLDWFLNSPSHHRVHHGCNPEYIDKNFGGVFIVWDRLFGTFAKEQAPVRFGMGRPMQKVLENVFGEWAALFKDLRARKTFASRIKVLFEQPGFSSHPRR